MMERACLIVAVFIETSTPVLHRASDKCSSRALVFSGWSCCDCEKSFALTRTLNTSCVSETLLMTVRQIIKDVIGA